MTLVVSEPLTQKRPTARLDAENFRAILDVEINSTKDKYIARK
jgi:hypothetical protein